jgi:predicted nucleotidyltransferase component of viral defense system
MRSEYEKQVKLLLKVLPSLNRVDSFALKGGTAINFFVQDFPRLSVDIDVTYVKLNSRNEALKDIQNGIEIISEDIKKRMPESNLTKQKSGGAFSKLIIWENGAQIKLEVNTVLRGSIFEPEEMELSDTLQDHFETFVAVKVLSKSDLYGGKICAALDRQHPRDLFDMKVLLDSEGITNEIRTAFLGYLISHSRPMSELLHPNVLYINDVYVKEFEGMTEDSNILEDLIEVQHKLPEIIGKSLTKKEQEFLLSLKSGNPDWSLIEIAHLQELPGVKWKLQNIQKMDKRKHTEAYEKLEKCLSMQS